MPFWPPCCESEAILLKKFRPGHQAGVFIWENFYPSYRDLGRKDRDLGNRASPVDQAHMKRPLVRWASWKLTGTCNPCYS